MDILFPASGATNGKHPRITSWTEFNEAVITRTKIIKVKPQKKHPQIQTAQSSDISIVLPGCLSCMFPLGFGCSVIGFCSANGSEWVLSSPLAVASNFSRSAMVGFAGEAAVATYVWVGWVRGGSGGLPLISIVDILEN